MLGQGGAAFAPGVNPVKYSTHSSHAKGPKGPMIQFVKTKLCKHYTKGYCKFEDHCFFAHDLGELLFRPDLTKTKLCQTFMMTGACSNDRCSFAHGVEDLRPVGGVFVPPALGQFQDSLLAACSRERMSAANTLLGETHQPEYIELGDLKTRRIVRKSSFQQASKDMTNKQRQAMPAPVSVRCGDTEDVHSTPTSTSAEFEEWLDPLEPVRVTWAVPSKWLLMVESLLRQRRAQMVHHGRILLNKSRSDFDTREVSRAEVDTVSAILLQEPGWCVEFRQLARRYSECLQQTSTPRTEPGTPLLSTSSDSGECI